MVRGTSPAAIEPSVGDRFAAVPARARRQEELRASVGRLVDHAGVVVHHGRTRVCVW